MSECVRFSRIMIVKLRFACHTVGFLKLQVDALMSLLMKLRSESPSVKSLVISQFTSMLNIMQTPLTAEGFNFVRLDGKMSHRRRAEVIEEFNNHSAGSPTVFLLSLKAGGVGLNLTAASRVFLLDPVCCSFLHSFSKNGNNAWLYLEYETS